MSEPEPKIAEADLVAFADGRMDAARREEMASLLADRPDERRLVETWREQTAELRAALDPVAEEPLPTAMLAALSASPRLRRPWRLPAMAAALALAIGLGGGWVLGNAGWPTFAAQSDRGDVIASTAYRAHRLYTAEIRHPVEVGADERDHLVTWLSKRIEAPLKTPDLSREGLRLLGGRLVPIERGPGAQLMYETDKGERYTLFVTGSDGARPTSFHFEEWGDIGCYYWIDGGLGFALNGPKDKDRLMAIARSVYEQLS